MGKHNKLLCNGTANTSGTERSTSRPPATSATRFAPRTRPETKPALRPREWEITAYVWTGGAARACPSESIRESQRGRGGRRKVGSRRSHPHTTAKNLAPVCRDCSTSRSDGVPGFASRVLGGFLQVISLLRISHLSRRQMCRVTHRNTYDGESYSLCTLPVLGNHRRRA
jgi:hypothetical protein